MVQDGLLVLRIWRDLIFGELLIKPLQDGVQQTAALHGIDAFFGIGIGFEFEYVFCEEAIGAVGIAVEPPCPANGHAATASISVASCLPMISRA